MEGGATIKRLALLFLASCALAQSPHTVTLTWTAPTVGGAPSTYSVMRGTASGGPYQQIASVPASVLTYVDTSATGNVLTEGQTYCYVILGTNASGSGPVSNEKCGVVPLSLPGPPSLTSASFK